MFRSVSNSYLCDIRRLAGEVSPTLVLTFQMVRFVSTCFRWFVGGKRDCLMMRAMEGENAGARSDRGAAAETAIGDADWAECRQ